MKYIIMIKGMNDEACKERIQKALRDEGIECKVDFENKVALVERNGDVIAKAKRIIVSLGFSVI